MNFVETEKGYLFIRECDRNFPEKRKKTYNIADGLWVTFGINGRDQRKRKLCRMSFSKAWFDLEEAEDFWRDMDIRLLEKKTNWNRKLPELTFAIDTNDGYVITGNYKGLAKYETLGKQYEAMDKTDEDIVDKWLEDCLVADTYMSDNDIDDYVLQKNTAKKLPEDFVYDGTNRYISMFLQQYKATDESVIAALSVLNATTLAQEGAEGDAFADRHGNDICEFFDFFMECIYTEAFEKKMLDHWGSLPRIIHIAASLVEEEQREVDRILDEAAGMLSGKRKRNAERLAGYFLRDKDKMRFVTISTDSLHIKTALRPEEEERNRQEAYRLTAGLFAAGGGCIFRTVMEDGHEIANGFYVQDGKPECIPVQELRRCMQTQPDGSVMEFPNDQYQIAFVKFEK